jgi:hypothetical protein
MHRPRVSLPRALARWTLLLSALTTFACGADQGPVPEQDIDGTWDVLGLYSLDVPGLVRCRLSGAFQLQKLSGANTVVGTGQHSFDCVVDGTSQTFDVDATLMNSRLDGTELSMTLGPCQLLAKYRRDVPDLIDAGRAYCRMSFAQTGLIDVAGTWEGYREAAP